MKHGPSDLEGFHIAGASKYPALGFALRRRDERTGIGLDQALTAQITEEGTDGGELARGRRTRLAVRVEAREEGPMLPDPLRAVTAAELARAAVCAINLGVGSPGAAQRVAAFVDGAAIGA